MGLISRVSSRTYRERSKTKNVAPICSSIRPSQGFIPSQPLVQNQPKRMSYRFNNPSQTPWQRLPTEAVPDPYPTEVYPNETYPRKGETIISFFLKNWELADQQHSWVDRFKARFMVFLMFAATFYVHSKMDKIPAAEHHTHEEHHRAVVIQTAMKV